LQIISLFAHQGVAVPRIVTGGTPGFLPDFDYLAAHQLDAELWLSPGTWVLFDTSCGRKMPDTFAPAALILTQVIDKTAPLLRTLNLGHKRWAVDQGAVEEFSHTGVQALRWSEEHTVIEIDGTMQLEIGDYLAIVPKHICPTVNLYEHFTLVGSDGEVLQEICPIEARNR
jgi:D-serine deaminase-like pyridoxal phosphate-dependent protein